jgi:hypothetical protein
MERRLVLYWEESILEDPVGQTKHFGFHSEKVILWRDIRISTGVTDCVNRLRMGNGINMVLKVTDCDFYQALE